MVLHLPHSNDGFGVTFNDITKDDAFYTTTSHFVSWFGVFSQERQGLDCGCPRMTSRTHPHGLMVITPVSDPPALPGTRLILGVIPID